MKQRRFDEPHGPDDRFSPPGAPAREIASRRAKWSALGLVAGLSLVAAVASAGEVTGRFAVANRSMPPSQDAHYWNAWNGFVAAGPARVDLRREFTAVLRGGAAGDPVGCSYRIRGGDLLPRTMVVKAGARFRLENGDGTPHELTIEGIEGGAPIPTAAGNARPITAPAGGPYAVSDAVYAHIRGTIVPVDDLAACGTIGEDGAFSFPEVPAGNYKLAIYRGGEVVHEQDVQVGTGELEVPRINLN
ncbi:MAG: hypothetical protein AAF645_05995 [Myxococcota bacterium]